MKIVQVDGKEIKGISVRTRNADEMSPETSKIGVLWQNFYEKIAPNLKTGASVFGVYYDYESDAMGEFSVLAGTDGIAESSAGNLEKVFIQKGDYLLFEGNGEMPQVVIDTWSRVWDYFASNTAKYQRAYTTDFEFYKGSNAIEIHIAVK